MQILEVLIFVELYFAVPDIFLYPPAMSGSKFCKDNASPGLIEKISLFKTNPPKQLTTVGVICEVFGTTLYLYHNDED